MSSRFLPAQDCIIDHPPSIFGLGEWYIAVLGHSFPVDYQIVRAPRPPRTNRTHISPLPRTARTHICPSLPPRPVSTGGGTRRVQLVREEGGGGGTARADGVGGARVGRAPRMTRERELRSSPELHPSRAAGAVQCVQHTHFTNRCVFWSQVLIEFSQTTIEFGSFPNELTLPSFTWGCVRPFRD